MGILRGIIDYLCTVVFSVLSATIVYTLMFLEGFGFASFRAISLFMLVAYLIFATPVQIFLNRNPQKFHGWYLVTYFIVSLVVCGILALLTDYGLIVFLWYKLYVFSFLLALVYWFWDSVFIQKN
ncbi:membrane protein [Bacillus glycinifermentans]|uniref:UPF0715 family protein n=1 Tax=Bacillus glycinifermentans TaxID=1664069 RepID=A0A0J6EI05_9BACI|nr:UPF0715 family protein [Bacillus glycinifermentans]ATH94726.1 hypothetical protein COP00_20810 [Bacillus glycinifermentans]KMM57223.1 membrane protein [Bacillus glycinifermentans]KRT92007.1 hypothetical protein AB447_222690 [Bacillus glycinifermentans]MEC0486448.1 UPF0715 family protein [Bacillus glycinifermentans]MEC0494098.1 UPF0715 family protein [Bacillus glycinifermentans]